MFASHLLPGQTQASAARRAVPVGLPPALRLRSWYRGDIAPGRTSPLEMLVIQGSPFCNIDCRYCYLPARSDRSVIDLGHIDTLFAKLAAAGLLGDRLSVIFHAGEPLALPVAFYEDAVARLRRLAPGTRLDFGIQTNGMLISDEFCAFFRQNQISVGVSLDGPAFIHDAARLTRRGGGTHAAAMAGVARLQAGGVKFNVIGVLTSASLGHADAMFEFFAALGAQNVAFNIEEVEGEHRVSSLSGPDLEARYRAFWQRFLFRCRHAGFPFEIREYNQALGALRALAAGQRIPTAETNPLGIIAIDHTGKLHTYSPELMTARAADGTDFSIGHVDEIEFQKFFAPAQTPAWRREIAAGVARCRERCGYFPVCGGGSPTNKLAEHGHFAGTETQFCRLTKQAMVQIAAAHVANAAAGASPRPAQNPVPAVAQTKDYVFRFEEWRVDDPRLPNPATFGHLEVRRWNHRVRRELRETADALLRLHGGPLHVFVKPEDGKLKRFLGLLGFAFHCPQDGVEIWRRSAETQTKLMA